MTHLEEVHPQRLVLADVEQSEVPFLSTGLLAFVVGLIDFLDLPQDNAVVCDLIPLGDGREGLV